MRHYGIGIPVDHQRWPCQLTCPIATVIHHTSPEVPNYEPERKQRDNKQNIYTYKMSSLCTGTYRHTDYQCIVKLLTEC